MVVYLTMTMLTLVFSYVFSRYNKTIDSEKHIRWEIWFVLIIWVLVYALRYMTGTDFGGYLRAFNRASTMTYSAYVNEYRDWAFYSMTYFLNRIFFGNFVAYEVVLAVLSYLPILLVCHEESEQYTFSILLFIFILNYFNPFNGVRQGIAVGLLFYAYYMLLKKRKYIKFAIVVIIAFGIHSTALFVLPFFFLSLLKLRNKLIWIIFSGITLSYFVLSSVWQRIIDLFEATGQEKLATDYSELEMQGSSFTRFFVALLPVIIALIFYNRLKAVRDDVDGDIILTMFSAVFMLFSMKSWIFARVAYYFSTSSVLLISKIPHMFEKENNKRMIAIVITVLYFIYMVALLLHGDGGYLPYNFITDFSALRSFR